MMTKSKSTDVKAAFEEGHSKGYTKGLALGYEQGFADGKAGRRRDQQAESFRGRYNSDSRKGEKFRQTESLRKKDWQASPAGQESNRERQRRWQEKQRALRTGKRLTPASAKKDSAAGSTKTKPARTTSKAVVAVRAKPTKAKAPAKTVRRTKPVAAAKRKLGTRRR
jgi:hypothetical protein